jgi:hypothetical protein
VLVSSALTSKHRIFRKSCETEELGSSKVGQSRAEPQCPTFGSLCMRFKLELGTGQGICSVMW